MAKQVCTVAFALVEQTKAYKPNNTPKFIWAIPVQHSSTVTLWN